MSIGFGAVCRYMSNHVMSPGVPHGKDVDYLFGHPFFNMTLGNLTGVVPGQLEWTELDRNISEFVQNMWLNFTLTGWVDQCDHPETHHEWSTQSGVVGQHLKYPVHTTKGF